MRFKTLSRMASVAVASTVAVAGLAASAPSAFAAGTPTASATTPTTNLLDGSIVGLTGSGFSPTVGIQVEECAGTAAKPPTSNADCDGTTLDAQAYTDAAGNFQNFVGDPAGDTGVKVYTVNVPGSLIPQSTITCDATHACVLYVGEDQGNFSAPHVWVDISFAAPAANPVAPVLKNASTTAAFGGSSAVVKADSTGYVTSAVDSAGNPETVTPTVVSSPAHGTVAKAANGDLTYTETDAAWTTGGTDTFTVNATGKTSTNAVSGVSNTVTITVNVAAAPHAVAPVLQAKTVGPVNFDQTATIKADSTGYVTTAVDSAGAAETVTPTITQAPANGTVAIAANGDLTYTPNNGTPGGADTFKVTATGTKTGDSPATSGASNEVTITVNVTAKPAYPASCTVPNGGNCSLAQIIVVPVNPGSLSMTQNPTDGEIDDTLNKTVVAGACTGPAITLDGQAHTACGGLKQIRVDNFRGTDAAWTLTGQVSDFADHTLNPTLDPTFSCTAATNNHCINGNDLNWTPSANHTSTGSNDIATIAAGSAANALHTAAKTLCSSPTGKSGGTFTCDAGFTLPVPSSVAADSAGYRAVLTLTLA